MKIFLKFLRVSLILGFTGFFLGVIVLAGAYLYLAPSLPSIDVLKDVRLQTPLRVFSRDGALVAEFGEKKRSPLQYDEFPDLMVKAVLAAEDDRFFEHPGVDYQGILRATVHLLKTGEKGQGGSTITMQVARNFFLSREKTYLRKLSEIFLALKIERELSKQDILELYMNKIYLGQRSYGFASAAQVYYGKEIEELRLEQLAMLAGLPKAPSKYNPVSNLKRATIRRDYVLGRMRELDYIDEQTYQQARESRDDARIHGLDIQLEAPYIAEMVRARLVEEYGTDAYASGYRVFTTLDTRAQRYANAAVKRNLLDYDRRHGWRGAETRLLVPADIVALLPEDEKPVLNARDTAPQLAIPDIPAEILEPLRAQVADISTVGDLPAAVVLLVGEKGAIVLQGNGELVALDWDAIKWARKYINENSLGPALRSAAEVLKRGDVVRLELTDKGPLLAQLPEVSGALVSISPEDGAIRALVGGFDFYHSKFNRVTQAQRQPGSNFKPFVYSAALENGYTAASIINDAPVVFEDKGLEDTWRPENYSGKFYGPTRLRVALTNSRNLVSIRLLRAVGISKTIEYAERFGFDKNKLPKDLSLALGSASMPPLDIVRGYAVFANGGYRVEPYFIERIEDGDGKLIYQSKPLRVCRECEKQQTGQAEQQASASDNTNVQAAPLENNDVINAEQEQAQVQQQNIAERVITEQNAYIMRTIMRDVVLYGTGRRALQIGRRDLAGKTGTTNDQKDAWFSGYSSSLVTTVWVGFDSNKPLGNRETGARAALPMWVDFMGNAMKGVPEVPYPQPEGLVTVRIDAETGLLATNTQQNAVFETFREEFVPTQRAATATGSGSTIVDPSAPGVTEQLF